SLARGGLYYSPRVQEVLGYSPAYLLKHSSLWHELIHPEDQERVDKAVRSMGTEDKFCLEYRIKDSEGEWHWFLDRFIGQESEGDETFIEGLATDITGLKQGLGSMKRIVDPTFTHLKE
ncbi:MAG: PAS domain-containing protein, partial [Nitrospinota bacterium]